MSDRAGDVVRLHPNKACIVSYKTVTTLSQGGCFFYEALALSLLAYDASNYYETAKRRQYFCLTVRHFKSHLCPKPQIVVHFVDRNGPIAF